MYHGATPILALALAALPAAAQTAADFYDDSSVQELRLEIHPKDWAALRENFLDNTYYPANFQWRGVLVENVGIRSRGRGSRSGVKPNLKIDFNRYEDQKFLGLKSTTLKANNQDASMMKERLAMALFDKLGVPTPREAFARLYINGEYFGLYNLIETADKDFLRRVFHEDEGYLYEWKPSGDPGYRFEYLGDDPALYSPARFDPVTHEKDPNPAPLVDMIRAINHAPDAEFVETVSRYLDLEQFVRHIAAEAYMGESDGILGDIFGMNNFNFYRLAGTERHVFLPWDKDSTMLHNERDIWAGVDENALTRRLLAIPEYKQLYLASLMRAAELMGPAGGFIDELIARYYSQMAADARSDPSKQCSTLGVVQSCGAAEFEAGVDAVREFAQTRGFSVASQANALGYAPPASIAE